MRMRITLAGDAPLHGDASFGEDARLEPVAPLAGGVPASGGAPLAGDVPPFVGGRIAVGGPGSSRDARRSASRRARDASTRGTARARDGAADSDAGESSFESSLAHARDRGHASTLHDAAFAIAAVSSPSTKMRCQISR